MAARIIEQLIAAGTDQIVHAAVFGTERTLLYFLCFFLQSFTGFFPVLQKSDLLSKAKLRPCLRAGEVKSYIELC